MSDELTLPFEPDAPPQNICECPEPGVYRDIPFETYATWRAINSGIVKWLDVSPKHGHAAFNGDIKADDTRSMKLGRAIHCMLLEPETFDSRFEVAGECESVLKSGERKGQSCGATAKHRDHDGRWLCGKHPPEEQLPLGDVITANELDRCKAIKAALHDHWAVKLFRRKGWSEVSLVWEFAGLPMKCRLDRYAPEGRRPIIIDVKKCMVGRGDLATCEKSIERYGWATQAAMYVEGVQRVTGKRPEFVWVFVEDDRPFDVNVIPASEETIKIGWHIARNAIQRYARSVKANELPGYLWVPENVKPGGLSVYAVKQALAAGWLNEGSDDDSSDDDNGTAGDVWPAGDGSDEYAGATASEA